MEIDAAVDVLFLDAGGVLVSPSWTLASEALARHGVTVTAAALAAADPRARHELDRGTVIAATDDRNRGWLYFDTVLRHAGIASSPATDAALDDLRRYHAAHNLWETVLPGVPEALQAFRDAGLRLTVVSNANGVLRRLLDRVDLARWFDVVLDSHELGVEKPDPRLFAIALERSGVRPERAVHVGDFYHIDVVGARAAGVHAILLDEAGLYGDVDCPRVATLGEVLPLVRGGPAG